MPRLVLHIGTHKTGTTSLQNHWHANRQALSQVGIVYPDLTPHSGHHGFLTDWIALPQVYALPKGGGASLKHLADTYRDTDTKILLSSEEFSRAGGRGGKVDFIALRKIFSGYQFQVLCVLRPQAEFLQSVYLELSRHSLPNRPPDYLKSCLESGQVDGLWCDYGGLYRQLREAFEPSEIFLIDYASARRSKDGLVGTIWRAISPEISDPTIVPDRNWANASPRVLPIWASQVVAGWTVPPAHLKDAAAEAFDLHFESRPQCLFTRQEHTALTAQLHLWNQGLQDLVYMDGAEFVLSIAAHDPATIHREDIDQEYWIRLARRLSFACSADAA